MADRGMRADHGARPRDGATRLMWSGSDQLALTRAVEEAAHARRRARAAVTHAARTAGSSRRLRAAVARDRAVEAQRRALRAPLPLAPGPGS
jgi:hypothetical protein